MKMMRKRRRKRRVCPSITNAGKGLIRAEKKGGRKRRKMKEKEEKEGKEEKERKEEGFFFFIIEGANRLMPIIKSLFPFIIRFRALFLFLSLLSSWKSLLACLRLGRSEVS